MLRIPSSLKLLPGLKAPRLDPIQPMTEADLERFLRDFSLEELRQVREFWQTYARRKTLIDAKTEHDS